MTAGLGDDENDLETCMETEIKSASHRESRFRSLAMKTKKKEIEIPSVMLAIRKASRWFAGFWFFIALLLLISGIVDIVDNWQDPGAYSFIPGVIFIILAGSIFWYVPDWFIQRNQRSIAETMNDQNKEIHSVSASTGISKSSRVEIVHKASEEESEPVIKEDDYGRITFDSTQRPLRIIFGGIFLVIGLAIGLIIFLASEDIGFFEYFWVIGWSTFCLASMGLVYEIVIHKREGFIDRKAGWFFIIRKQRFDLRDFDGLLVKSTFHHSWYDRTRERYHSQEPKFKVDLTGDCRLNIRVFNNVTDARRLAAELAGYLGLPLAEESEVRS